MALRQAPAVDVAAALLLAFLAGCVDAVGFSYLGGVFVSFMSGNTTRLGLELVGRDWTRAVAIAGVIGSFVLGAALGTLFGALGPRWRRAALLILEATALLVAAVIGHAGEREVAAALMALAMGMENEVVVTGDGQTRVGLTYVSGALVKVGEGLGLALRGGPRWGWWPSAALWLSLLLGVVAGGAAYAETGLGALVAISGLLSILAAGFVWIDRHAARSS